jgi:hypothetical protein
MTQPERNDNELVRALVKALALAQQKLETAWIDEAQKQHDYETKQATAELMYRADHPKATSPHIEAMVKGAVEAERLAFYIARATAKGLKSRIEVLQQELSGLQSLMRKEVETERLTAKFTA